MNTLKNLSKIFDGSYNESCNLQDLCRLCGNIKMNMVSVFNKADEHDYSTIISIHFRDFHITECDILPTKLCVHCITSLMSWHKFYNNCMDVNNQLIRIQEKLEKLKSSIKEENTSNIKMENSIINTDIKLLNSIEECVHNQDNIEDISDIEVIEIKFDRDGSLRTNDVYSGSTYSEEVYDIANVQMHDDVPELQIVDNVIDKCDLNDGIKDKKLDIEEMAISEEDLCTSNDNCQPTPIVSEDFEITKNILRCQNEIELPIGDCNKTCSTYNEKQKNLSKLRNRLRICHLCGKHYTTDSGFRHHMVMHREPSFSCHLCGRVFYESQNLKKHLAAIHSEERPFQCHMCGTKYKRRDVLQEHIKRVHDGVKRVWNPQLLKKYRGNAKIAIKGRYQCPHCNKCMASKGYLNDHINGAHIKEELYKCKECPMTFTRKASFKYHFKRAHILKKRVLEPRGTFLKDCEYCGLQFQIKKYYEIHVASKHFNKYPCEHCEQIFDNKFYLAKHTETKHADSISKCKLCGKSFSEDTHLKRHIYLCHTERNPYECHNCGYKANKKSTLEVHMRRHTGEKPYQCDVCTKRFAQSVDYRKHRANHFKHKLEKCNNLELKENEYINSNEIIVKTKITNEKKSNQSSCV